MSYVDKNAQTKAVYNQENNIPMFIGVQHYYNNFYQLQNDFLGVELSLKVFWH